jgi:hypothetical protein
MSERQQERTPDLLHSRRQGPGRTRQDSTACRERLALARYGVTVITAKYPGDCPLCGNYIATKRSRVVALPEKLVPSLEHIFYDAARRSWRDRQGAGKTANTHPRRWAHARCALRHLNATRGQDQRAIAVARATALVQHRKTEMELNGVTERRGLRAALARHNQRHVAQNEGS